MNEKPQPDFTLDEMAREMAGELGYKLQDDPGYTAAEFAGSWGIAVSTARRWLHELDKQGKIIKGRARRIRSDGKPLQVTVYLFNPNPEKGGETDATV